jgi:hypothetical protein
MARSSKKVKIFKITNRRGYACLCSNHLTEGRTPYQAYQRMGKALRRRGVMLRECDARAAAKLVTDV